MNTIGNCMVLDTLTESALISPKGGFGGIGGGQYRCIRCLNGLTRIGRASDCTSLHDSTRDVHGTWRLAPWSLQRRSLATASRSRPAGFTKPIALANVYQLRQRLDASIDIVGVGGVKTGEDAFQLILCGADAVQTATTHWLEGPECFDRIAAELSMIMHSKGYSSIADFKGKLKPYDKANKPKETAEEGKSDGGITKAQLVYLCLALLLFCLFMIARDMGRNMTTPDYELIAKIKGGK